MTTQSNYGRTKFPTGTNLDLFVIADDASDFILRAEDHRHALMQVGRLDVHDASYPLEDMPPACSTMKDIGLASYSKRSLPPLIGSFVSLGYRNTPPRVRMRCTSATIDATQRILKLIPRGPVFPATHSST